MSIFSHVAIVGLGMIGGAIAQRIKSRSPGVRVTAVDIDADSLALAKKQNIIDAAVPLEALNTHADVQLIILAAPPQYIVPMLQHLLPVSTAIITDTASIKGQICDAIINHPESDNFVPGHPIAGTENTGYDSADPSIFNQAKVVLTPCSNRARHTANYEKVKEFWSELGVETLRMAPHQHDKLFANISHLPHVLAWTLLATLQQEYDTDTIARFQGGGFKGMTRIAASDPDLWTQIIKSNADEVRQSISAISRQLETVQSLIDKLEYGGREAEQALASWLANISTEQRKIHSINTEPH